MLDKLPAWIRGDRYLPLLVSLVAMLLLLPVISTEWIESLVSRIGFTFVFVTGALANRRRPRIFLTAVVMAAVAIVLSWIRPREAGELMAAHLIADIAFFVFTAVLILIAVVMDRMHGGQAVLGAICAYLLLGLAWALGYRLLECMGDEPFRFVERYIDSPTTDGRPLTDLSQLIYFSFVTMTTLGYGDIAPRTPLAQTVCWMQAVAGQLYIAIMIARLVSEIPSRRK